MNQSGNNHSPWLYQPPEREIYQPFYDAADSISYEVAPFFYQPQDSIATVQEVRLPRPDFGDPRNPDSQDWIALVLLVSVAIFAFARYNFGRRMGQLLKACFLPRAVAHLYREGNPFNEQVTLALGAIYLLTSSLFIFVVLDYFNWLPTGLVDDEWIYVTILGANSVYWLLKAAANRMLAHIFKTYDATGSYLLNNLLFNLTLGLLLLLLLPFMVYTGSEFIIKAGLYLAAALLVYKVFRGIMVGISITRFPLFYLFLYITALELAPILLIVKYFM